MANSFEDIIRQSRDSKFAIILDGVEANVLMLAIEVMLDSPDITVARETLREVLEHLKVVVGKRRFVELVDLKDLPEITEEAVREAGEGKIED